MHDFAFVPFYSKFECSCLSHTIFSHLLPLREHFSCPLLSIWVPLTYCSSTVHLRVSLLPPDCRLKERRKRGREGGKGCKKNSKLSCNFLHFSLNPPLSKFHYRKHYFHSKHGIKLVFTSIFSCATFRLSKNPGSHLPKGL